MTSTSGLACKGLVKRYGSSLALDGVALRVGGGEIVGVTGPNGAGKTTLLKVFATLLHPDEGRATVNGHDVVREGATVRKRIGVMLVNERALYWRLSARENLRFFGRVAGLSRREVAGRSDDLLALLDIATIADRRVSGYSAGQRQRLLLARALLAEPSALLLDEPVRGLDDDGKLVAREVLRAAADRGAAVLVTGPSLEDLDDMFDRTHVMRHGVMDPASTERSFA